MVHLCQGLLIEVVNKGKSYELQYCRYNEENCYKHTDSKCYVGAKKANVDIRLTCNLVNVVVNVTKAVHDNESESGANALSELSEEGMK